MGSVLVLVFDDDDWIPAFAGMTGGGVDYPDKPGNDVRGRGNGMGGGFEVYLRHEENFEEDFREDSVL